ncbi:MAG TPA: DNA polymerase/3'-5' exonuclease PolX [Candidatus Pacearchaeota archaeon]|nr:DNA polymerase/3'-5' exonuclease PolX [Candidatus Pacearchaeota archaeon]HPR79829.1 DNA polymerase/3'-5' exonuclease PolX [Candidatus Pacearchaeota archaeon]
MKNQEVAQILFEIGEFLELQEIPFKPQAYQQAAIAIDNMEEDILDLYKKEGIKGLEKIPGVGKSIAEKIEEFLKTGKVKYLKEIKKASPIDLEELTKVEGLGVKRIKKLWKELGVRNLKDLEKALDDHKIAPLFGFGEKMEQNILESIQFLKQGRGRFLLREIIPEVERILEKFKKINGVVNLSVAGSTRRRKETIGDVDFLVAIKDTTDKYLVEKIMNTFVSMDEVIKVVGKGETKSSIRTKNGLSMDLRLVSEGSFGAAMQYFTGSKDHNIALRRIAIKQGYKLNEYGLFRNERKIKGEIEEEIYEKLGMDWIPPEMRENQGEIELATEKKLPKLIELKDIKGDFHCHTSWDGGEHSIKEMAEKAISLGYEYIGIADHTQSLKIENGLNEKRLLEQRKEIDLLNKSFIEKGIDFKILQGSEVDILKDGSLDINDKTLQILDYVSVSIHSNFKMGKREMTKRIIKAIEHPLVKILNHPTGMILGRRGEYEVDIDEVLKAAQKNNVALEMNSYRSDIGYQTARLAKEMGIKLTIGSDAHNKKELVDMQFGVYQARRGWLEKGDVLNALTLDKLSLKK